MICDFIFTHDVFDILNINIQIELCCIPEKPYHAETENDIARSFLKLYSHISSSLALQVNCAFISANRC